MDSTAGAPDQMARSVDGPKKDSKSMVLSWLSPLMRFTQCNTGNVAILFGLMAVPLFVIAGGAIDFNRFVRYNAQLQGAVDSAALALSRQDPDEIDINGFADDYVQAVMRDETTGNPLALTINQVTAQFDRATNTAIVNADAVMATSMLRLASIETLNLDLTAQVQFSQNNIDVVLVTDVTGSMIDRDSDGNVRIDSLREAAEAFATNLASLARTTDQIQLGIVPYTNTVNIKTDGFAAMGGESWIDINGRAKYNGHFFRHPQETPPPAQSETSHWNLFRSIRAMHISGRGIFGGNLQPRPVDYGAPNKFWKGCVEARGGTRSGGAQNSGVRSVDPTSYDLTDDPPNSGDPDTLFVPYFSPDEPGLRSDAINTFRPHFANSYLEDRDISQADIALPSYPPQLAEAMWREIANFEKYNDRIIILDYRSNAGADGITLSTVGPNRSCPEPLLDLTDLGERNGLEIVRDKLSDPGRLTFPPEKGTPLYDSGGGTNTVMGTVWGWRVLSPGEPFDARASTQNNPVEKILVVMTDGRNQYTGSHGSGRLADGDYSSYGYKADFDRFTPHRLSALGNQAHTHIDERLKVLCENIKADDVTVYTATIGVDEVDIQELYRGCASPDNQGQPRYRNLRAGDIGDFFDDIVADISSSRLTN